MYRKETDGENQQHDNIKFAILNWPDQSKQEELGARSWITQSLTLKLLIRNWWLDQGVTSTLDPR